MTEIRLYSEIPNRTMVVNYLELNSVRMAIVERWQNTDFTIEVEHDDIPSLDELKKTIIVSDFDKWASCDLGIRHSFNVVCQFSELPLEEENRLVRQLRTQFHNDDIKGWEYTGRDVRIEPIVQMTILTEELYNEKKTETPS